MEELITTTYFEENIDQVIDRLKNEENLVLILTNEDGEKTGTVLISPAHYDRLARVCGN